MSFGLSVQFVSVECCSCRVQFAMTAEMEAARRKDHDWFYCPNGHRQHYTGETDEEKQRRRAERAEQENARLAERAAAEKARLEAERDQARSRALHQERRASTFKGHCTRVKKKVSLGKCPCCAEEVVFKNLRRHMTKHHPDWQPDAEPMAPKEVVPA